MRTILLKSVDSEKKLPLVEEIVGSKGDLLEVSGSPTLTPQSSKPLRQPAHCRRLVPSFPA